VVIHLKALLYKKRNGGLSFCSPRDWRAGSKKSGRCASGHEMVVYHEMTRADSFISNLFGGMGVSCLFMRIGDRDSGAVSQTKRCCDLTLVKFDTGYRPCGLHCAN